jgi:TetR/AcrR family transcriptional regulator, transcriptional repressor of aconitase
MAPKISDELKEKRRQQILEAAERVFTRTGYEPATLKDIVEETGMSRGWIYLYFQTKEEVFEALVDKIDEEQNRAIEELLRNSPSVWEVIRILFTLQKEEFDANRPTIAPAVYEYFLSGWRDETRRQRLAHRYEKSITRFVQMLQTGVDKGEFAPILPLQVVAKIISSHLEGIMMHALAVGPDQADASRQLDALLEYIKTLLGVRNESPQSK